MKSIDSTGSGTSPIVARKAGAAASVPRGGSSPAGAVETITWFPETA